MNDPLLNSSIHVTTTETKKLESKSFTHLDENSSEGSINEALLGLESLKRNLEGIEERVV